MEEPQGGLTLVFTDIEGSTVLLRELQGSYGLLLRVHHRMLERAFEEHRGRSMGSEGDSVFFVFPTAHDAVLGAVTAQQRVEHHSWPDGVRLRVRIGIHSGPVTISGGEYVGLTVHEVSRICARGARRADRLLVVGGRCATRRRRRCPAPRARHGSCCGASLTAPACSRSAPTAWTTSSLLPVTRSGPGAPGCRSGSARHRGRAMRPFRRPTRWTSKRPRANNLAVAPTSRSSPRARAPGCVPLGRHVRRQRRGGVRRAHHRRHNRRRHGRELPLPADPHRPPRITGSVTGGVRHHGGRT